MDYVTKIKDKFLFIPYSKSIGFSFRMETWMLLSDYTQLAPMDFGELNEADFISKTCYCAARLYNLENGHKVDFTEDKVKYWIEDCMTTRQGKELVSTLFKSRIGGESLEDLIPKFLNVEKKKSPGMKSKTMQSVS